MDLVRQLTAELGLGTPQVANTLALFDEGATVPFIARYRKERTGSLDELQIRDLLHKYEYYKELDERRGVILESIESQGKLTPELKAKIQSTLSKTELEDLYLPYRPKRITRGKKATDAGLEPLADWLLDLDEPSVDLHAAAAAYVNAEKGYDTPQKALRGACDILAERLSDNADHRKWLRELAARDGEMVSAVTKGFAEQKTKFTMYYEYREKVSTVPSHRALAMFRGEREKVLRLSLDFPREKACDHLAASFVRHPGSAAEPLLRETVADCLERLLAPATETEIRNEIRERAEVEAFRVFNENLRALLMAPPAGRRPVLGVDPGFRTGCKVVALDGTGKFLEYQTIYPNEPQRRTEQAAATIRKLLDTHAVELVAIGNGTASRETEQFMRDVVSQYDPERRPTIVIVNESGASVYSASDVAIREFPDQDVTVRGAVSIARRLQDPLSELVKIDPKAIGVGQYQHDVNQAKLRASLEEVVESCVNQVGVDLNLASEELLRYVAGLSRTIAGNIVAYRNAHGAYESRDSLMAVQGLGPKTFEQAAGFLRVPGSVNPLDNSAVHPERYELVGRMAADMGVSVAELIGSRDRIRAIGKRAYVSDDVGLPTIEDILAELEKPGRDPRAQFVTARFDENVKEVEDLRPGMKLQGTVTNVTNFGAFVDVGVHQDGLVHISELADRFVSDPRAVVKVGQVVDVTVVNVDTELKRISLSMRKEPGAPRGRNDSRREGREQPRRDRGNGRGGERRQGGQSGKGKKLFTVKPKFSIKQIMK
ncbi:MAG: S1 RNA-binding domain-containing protein [Chitinivibrionales bacterium]|nr:S1 RNA-binding domain-containing protein [Chitinivibrionales bacterium]